MKQLLILIFCLACLPNTILTQERESDVIAIVGQEVITQKEVDKIIIESLFPLQQQIYAIRKTALNDLIVKTILINDAKKRGITVQALKKQLTSISTDIPQNVIDQAYIENKAAFGFMSREEAKERIRLDMETQARMRNFTKYIDDIKKKGDVEIYLKEPVKPRVVVTLTGPEIGNPQAEVTIVEFSDFQCPFCKQSVDRIKQILVVS